MVGKLFSVFSGGGTATDPVCGMEVSRKHPGGGTFDYKGVTYYFCGRGCRLEFTEDPEGFLSGSRKAEM